MNKQGHKLHIKLTGRLPITRHPQACWKKKVSRTSQKATKIRANLTLGGMMFQKARVMAENSQTELFCRWDPQHAFPARLDGMDRCNWEEAVPQIT